MSAPGPLVDPDTLPDWLAPLVRATARADGRELRLMRRPAECTGTPRQAAVLVLFGADEHTGEPDVLLQLRAEDLTAHAGQVSFPGGSTEDGDDGPVSTALREAAEEVGVRPSDIDPVALLPALWVPPADFLVTPVLAFWRTPGPVHAVDPAETAAVARVPIAMLRDSANRISVRGRGGWSFPAFVVPGMLVWGFTGGLLDALLKLAGWIEPGDPAPEYDLAGAWALARSRSGGQGSPSRTAR